MRFELRQAPLGVQILRAFDGDEPVGQMVLRDMGNELSVLGVTVVPERRGEGIGTEIIAEYVRRFRDRFVSMERDAAELEGRTFRWGGLTSSTVDDSGARLIEKLMPRMAPDAKWSAARTTGRTDASCDRA